MPRTTRVLLLQGDYADRLEHLWAAAQAAKGDTSPLLDGEDHPYDTLKAEYEDLRAEAEKNGIAVEMTAVGRTRWRELKATYPPRTEGDSAEADRLAGVNTDDVEDDLVFASIGEPKFASRDEFNQWAGALSEGEWQVLLSKAWELANGARLDPKALPALPTRSTETN